MNPFCGTLSIVRYGAAEAVTVDGVEWDIYVNDDELLIGIDESTNIRPVKFATVIGQRSRDSSAAQSTPPTTSSAWNN